MSDDFFRTRMGHRFFESTLPKIADQLERLVAELRKHREAAQPPTTESPKDAPGAPE